MNFETLNQIMKENRELGSYLHLNTIEGFQSVKAQPMEGTHYVSVVNGIALVHLIGPIFPRANMMTEMSGATSIQQYGSDFFKAYNDKEVKGVIQVVDSPGGDVRGIGENAKMINRMVKSGQKPVKTYVQGYLASAAYYTGSTSEEIVSDHSGLSGSIGVVLSGQKKDDNSFEIVSSVSPDKRPDPSDPQGRAVLKEQVDDLANIFVSDVSKYRGVEKQKVLDDYGKGAVKVGPRARTAGLVDRLSSLSQVVEEMGRAATTTRVAVGKAAGWNEATIENLMYAFKEESLDAQDSDDSILDAQMLEAEEKVNMGFKDMLNRIKPTSKTLDNDTAQVTTPATESPKDKVAEGATTAAGTGATNNANLLQVSREDLMNQASDAGELFASKLVTSKKIYPFQQAGAAVEFINARADDAMLGGKITYINPLGEAVEGTREQAVTSKYEALQPHSLTEQAVEGVRTGAVTANVLAEGDEEKVKVEGVSDERKKQLLASSTQGRSALANQSKA